MTFLTKLLPVLAMLALLAPAASAAAAAQPGVAVGPLPDAGVRVDEERYLLETPVGPVELRAAERLLVLDYAHGGRLGDDTILLGQAARRLELIASMEGNPFLDGPLPPVLLEADLKDVRAEHPAFELLRQADAGAVEPVGVPVDLWVGEEGVDVGWAFAHHRRQAGAQELPYPSASWWYGIPLETDEDTVAVAPSYMGSTDATLLLGDDAAERVCAFGVERARQPGLAPACAQVAALDGAAAALPNVVLIHDLEEVGVKVNPPDAVEQALAAVGAGALADRALPGQGGPRGAPGEGEEALDGADALLPADGPAVAWPAAERGDALTAAGGEATLRAGDAALLAALAIAGAGLLALAIPLYRRIARAQVAGHDVRGRIVALVQAEPGLHESEAARRLGISHTLAQYHVRMLAEFGLVEVRKFGGRKCLFAAGQMGRAEKTLVLAEKGRGAQVVDIVASQPGIGQRELARALGIRESSVKWHLDRLEQNQVVVVERSLEGKRVRLSPEAERARGLSLARAALPAAVPGAEPRPEPSGPPAPADPREPSPLHAASA